MYRDNLPNMYGYECQECYAVDNFVCEDQVTKLFCGGCGEKTLHFKVHSGSIPPIPGINDLCLPGIEEYIENNPIEELPKKDDSSKAPMSLVPQIALEEVAKCMGFGCEKYGRHNYLKDPGFEYLRLTSAAMRHINAFLRCEEVADDSGLHHLAHAASACMMLLETIKLGKGIDDRYKP